MVAHPRHYPWSSYRVNAEGMPSDLIMPHDEYLALVRCNQSPQLAYCDLFDVPLDTDFLVILELLATGISPLEMNVSSRKYQPCYAGESRLRGRVGRLRKNNRGLSPILMLRTRTLRWQINTLRHVPSG